MKLIVGLGNPGEKYEGTRHNLGFLVLDQLLKDSQPVEKTVWANEKKFKSETFEISWEHKGEEAERVILAKPKTFMNNSGMAVGLLTSFYKIEPKDVWIVNDELDLPLGSMKIRFGGAAAGHHGVESIIGALGTDKFYRFRIGIGIGQHSARPMREDEGIEKTLSKRVVVDVEDFVLGGFKGREQREVKKILKHASDSLQVALEKGMEKAMNRFNSK